MEREDVVIVATVSAIYGLGDPVEYRRADGHGGAGRASAGATPSSRTWSRIQYARNDVSFEPGTFRVRGDTVEIFPAYEEQAVRIELWGDTVERITKIHPLTGEAIQASSTAAPSTRPSTSSPSAPRSSAPCA